MAKIRQVVKTCDLCGGDAPHHHTWTKGGKAFALDLCDEHEQRWQEQVVPFLNAMYRTDRMDQEAWTL